MFISVRPSSPASSMRPLGQAQGQLAAEEREAGITQQVRQTTDVVLVAVGQHAADDVVGSFDQPGEVGQDEVDAEHVGVGEHQAAVDEQQGLLELEHGAVATDLPEPAEEGDVDRGCHQLRSSSTLRARSASPSGTGPIGGRQSPTFRPSTRRSVLVGMGFGASSPVS